MQKGESQSDSENTMFCNGDLSKTNKASTNTLERSQPSAEAGGLGWDGVGLETPHVRRRNAETMTRARM